MEIVKIQQYWKLNSNNGRQTWSFNPDPSLYAEFYEDPEKFWNSEAGQKLQFELDKAFVYNKSENPNSADIVFRTAKTGKIEANFVNPDSFSPKDAADLATNYYKTLQEEDGHWAGDYGGPLFLLPGIIIQAYVTNTPFKKEEEILMKRYMLNMQNADGGWGLHIEDKSTMFGTVMQYVALRILGMQANDPEIAKARTWIQDHGGAIYIPTWGKAYLSILGAYDWAGVNCLLPELWILPRSLPFHPGKYWCHARMVYLGMSYCYGHKLVGKITELVADLREEIYVQPYGKIDWKRARNQIADVDLYFPHPPLLKFANKFLNFYERYSPKRFRRKAMDAILAYIDAEDDHTNFIDIGPVNKAFNTICVWHAHGPESERFKKHIERRADYLWVAEDGMKMQGYNGSQLWDTIFAAQSMLEGKKTITPAEEETLMKIHGFLDNMQIKEEVRDHKEFYRHNSVGGWPFSTVEHGWPITDCSAEGLKVSLLLERDFLAGKVTPFAEWRFKAGADLLLSFQNKDGGWASYENSRGPKWLEKLNPSEVFENIMIDYSYVECTSACIQGLKKFAHYFPDYRKEEIKKAIERGALFITKKQRSDGSFYGSWAVCFCYGTWFGVEGLLAAGRNGFGAPGGVSPEINKACQFLVSKQLADGGWGEHFESCLKKEYLSTEKGQVINTAWAVLSLMAANYPHQEVIDRGIQFIISRMKIDGDFPQEAISGLFNHNCMITYTSYRNVFPIWALNRYVSKLKS